MFDSANSLGGLANMLYDKSVDSKTKFKNKCLYIEGLVRFLEMYATNEIGNYEVDITKVALWVNSPRFENIDCYNIRGIFGVFKSIETDIINNVPMYRFLRLPDSVLSILEREHHNQLIEDFKKDCTELPCLGCIFYKTEYMSLGTIRNCSLEPYKYNDMRYRERFNPNRYKKCKFCTHSNEPLPNSVTELIDKCDNSCFRRSAKELNGLIESCRKSFDDMVANLDNSMIPVRIPNYLDIDLTCDDDVITDFARIFKDKKPLSEMRTNLRTAMFIEAMIRFIDIYAQTEIGSDYVADISKIANYVWRKDNRNFNFKCIEECYDIIENMIIDGFDVKKFIKHNNTF